MKPLTSTGEDSGTLQDLGRASVQIVHDLKNQLNGLKLYATFLRKRLERSDRPEDEQETVGKLISGLDRAANDLSTIVQYGREIELKTQPGCDLQKVLRSICSELGANTVFEPDVAPLIGEFDQSKLTDALRWIALGAAKYQTDAEGNAGIKVAATRQMSNSHSRAIVEWRGSRSWDHDPFRSFQGSDEIRMSLAAKIVAAHGGATDQSGASLVITLPLSD